MLFCPLQETKRPPQLCSAQLSTPTQLIFPHDDSYCNEDKYGNDVRLKGQ